MTGIVTFHPTRVFIGKIKYLRHAAEDNVERLLLKLAGALHTALVGEAFQLIKLIEQAAPILEPAAGQVQLHVIENVATLARVKRRVCLWQIANAGNAARYGAQVFVTLTHRRRHHEGVIRQTGLAVIQPRHAREQATHACLGGIAAGRHERRGAGMAAVAVGEAAHHGHLVCQLAEHRKMTAKGHTRQARLGFTEHRPILVRRGHLRVKGLDMRWAALQVQHHHAFAGENVVALARHCARGQQLWQRQPAQA